MWTIKTDDAIYYSEGADHEAQSVCAFFGLRLGLTCGGGRSLEVPGAERTPSPRYYRVPESSGAQTDVEGHCRCSQEPCSQPTSPRRQSGGSSFP